MGSDHGLWIGDVSCRGGVTFRGWFVGHSASLVIAEDPVDELEEVEAAFRSVVVTAESALEVEAIANGLEVMEALH